MTPGEGQDRTRSRQPSTTATCCCKEARASWRYDSSGIRGERFNGTPFEPIQRLCTSSKGFDFAPLPRQAPTAVFSGFTPAKGYILLPLARHDPAAFFSDTFSWASACLLGLYGTLLMVENNIMNSHDTLTVQQYVLEGRSNGFLQRIYICLSPTIFSR